jgi:hypothetical protein
MRRIALFAAGVASLAGCEVVAGIHDKTLAGDPSVACGQQPPDFLFCDDFDTETEAGATWLWDTPQGGASIDLDSNDFKTPPHSVRVFVPPASPQAQLGKTVGPLTQGARLAFDLRVDPSEGDLGSIPEVSVAQLLFAGNHTSINYVLGPGASCKIYAYDTSGGGGGWSVTQNVAAPTPGAWTRIVMAYDATQGLTVTEDGASLYTDGSVARGAPGSTDAIVGAVYVNPPGATPLQLELDDVVVRGQ